jgi:hypothetical protein
MKYERIEQIMAGLPTVNTVKRRGRNFTVLSEVQLSTETIFKKRSMPRGKNGTGSQSYDRRIYNNYSTGRCSKQFYDRELQCQCCKNLQRHE